MRQYYKLHKIKIIRRMKQLYKKNKKVILKRKKLYYKLNKVRIIKRVNQHYLKNRTIKLKYEKEYGHRKYNLDIEYRLKLVLRARLKQALKNNQKNGSAVKDLGCSVEFLRQYLESKFYGNMTWKNYGSYWQIDHIVPLYQFDLSKRKQFLKACNYKNLQPLTIEDHKKKTSKDLGDKFQ